MRVGENNKKDDKVQLYFQQLKEKLAYRYFFSVSDEESHSVRKRMWKIISAVFIDGILIKNSAKKAI